MKIQQENSPILFLTFILFILLFKPVNLNAQILINNDTTICINDQIFLGGGWQNTSGVYYDTTWCNVTACDVYTTTYLTVSPIINDTTDVVICQGDTYLLTNGNTASIAGVYLDNSISGSDCDTNQYIDLSIASTTPITSIVVECEPYTHALPDGSLVNTSGIYTVPLTSSAGCEFDFITVLTINESVHDTVYASICENEFHILTNGIPTNIPGEHTSNTLTIDGCTHTTTTFLHVDPIPVTNVDTVVCAGSLFFLPNGFPAFSSGSYSHTLTGSNGCDSIVNTNLLFQESQTDTINVSICQGDTYTFPDGTIGTTSGTTIFNYSTIHGCDSNVMVILNVQPIYNDTIIAGICNGASYTLPDGTVSNTPGIYSYTYSSILGCDSIFSVNLQLSSTLFSNMVADVCLGDSYLLPGGTSVNVAGTYIDTLTTLYGCDSVVTTNLNTHSPIITDIDTVVCSGTLYILPNGFPAFFGGNYSHTLSSSLGCDSIVNTTLTYQSSQLTTINVSICQGEEYILNNGDTISASGTFDSNYLSAHGCDSVIREIVTIHTNYADTIFGSLCNGGTYTLPDGTITSSVGNYTYSDISINGCDSITTIVLSNNASSYNNISTTICSGDTYMLPSGNIVSSPNIYYDTILSNIGCDSITILDLSIYPIDTTYIDTIVCNGTWYFLPNGFPAFSGGLYTHTINSSNGCDSVIITNLTYQGPQSTSIVEEICENEVYIMPDGTAENTTGIYDFTLISSYGCDSTVSIDLTVHPIFNDTNYITICDNETYLLPNGSLTNTPGTYNDTLLSSNNCDSIFSTVLIVESSNIVNYAVELCPGETFELIDGSIVNSPGHYHDTLTNPSGCDAIITTTITTFVPSNDTIVEYVCLGDTYILPDGTTTNTPGFYPFITNSNGNCDSITTIQLIQNTSGTGSVDSVFATICANEYYMLPDGTNVNTSGTYFNSFTTATICDSLIVTQLTVLSRPVIQQDITLCSGAPYTLPSGIIVTTSDIYYDTLVSSTLCDSIIITNLGYHSVDSTFITDGICPNSNYTLPDGSTTNSAGTYSFNYTNNQGCDSVVFINLTLYPVLVDTINATICDNENYFLPNGNLTNTAGTYTDTLLSSSNCDSIVTTILTAHSSNVINYPIELCIGDSTQLIDGSYVNTPGNYYDTLSLSTGCNAILITTITSFIPNNDTIVEYLCQGDTYILPDGSSTNMPGFYPFVTNSNGNCDSITTIQLIQNTSGTGSVDSVFATICANEFYTLPDGSNVNTSGTYFNSFTTATNCDSLIITQLTALQSPIIQQNIMLCFGTPYTLPSGTVVTTPNIYYDTLISSNLCDSIIITNLGYYPINNTNITDGICENDSYILPDGSITSNPGTYIFNYTNGLGCDSTVTLSLNLIPSSVNTQSINLPIGTSYVLPSGVSVNTAGTYVDTLQGTNACDSIIITQLSYGGFGNNYFYNVSICDNESYQLPDGSYTNSVGNYSFNYVANDGSDSIIHIILSVYPTSLTTIDLTLCSNESYTLPDGQTVQSTNSYTQILNSSHGCDSTVIFNITVEDTIETYVYAMICHGGYYTMPNGWPIDVAGLYEVTLTSSNGCDSIITTELAISDHSINFTPYPDVTLCDEKLTQITVDYDAYDYLWSNGVLGNSIYPSTPGTYTVSFVSNIGDCYGMDTINVEIGECEECLVYIPNTFTPNADLFNNTFGVVQDCEFGFSTFKFNIFNRWGNLIFSTNSPDLSWDGTYNNKIVPDGIYSYQLTYTAAGSAETQLINGHVNVIR